MSDKPSLHIKRVYEPASRDDGVRVLVDRLWPRGVAKATAEIDHWMKDVAPSYALRKQFHDVALTLAAFAAAYRAELREAPGKDELVRLLTLAGRGKITLLFAVRERERNNAAVLRDLLASS